MKKRILAILLSLAMMTSFAGCKSNTSGEGSGVTFTAGTYEGSAKGFGGEILATVELSEDKIEKITITGEKETPGIGSVPVETMGEDMVAKQIVAVDTVSGATVTSNAVIEAVTAALESAGVDASKLVAVEGDASKKSEETLDVDVVVVGAQQCISSLKLVSFSLNLLHPQNAAVSSSKTL